MKKRIVTLAMALAVVMGIAATAASGEKNISVVPGINLAIDGQKVTATNSAGEAIDVFAADGATYLPLRFLAEKLGMKVDWDQNTMTASVVTAPAFEQTVDWDAEYDVVVVGYGAAGSAAAITAKDAGANVLLLEKAPKGHEGGNSRVCAQGYSAVLPEDRENVLTYMKSLRGDFKTPSNEILEFYVDGMIENPKWSEEVLGLTDYTLSDHKEFPDLAGGGYKVLRPYGESLTGKAYATFQANVEKRNIEVWYESPAIHLIQDKDTGIIHGVVALVDGKEVNIRAKNGVVLACGGYENNEQMMEDYIGRSGLKALGNIKYNTGDGIKMAQEVGANLWHMGNNVICDLNFYNEKDGYCTFGTQPTISALGAVMVGGDGTRFMAESTKPSHGKVYFHGTNIPAPYPDDIFVIVDEEIRLSGKLDKTFSDKNEAEIASGWLVKANTLEELAKKLGLPADKFVETIKEYNGFVDKGEDPVFDRKPSTMVAKIDKAPYYGIRMVPAVCNTQGGPERNVNAEVIGLDGAPIPHLYVAGEMGDIWSYCYNAYSNVGSGLIFGRTAGANAAKAKTDVMAGDLVSGEGFKPAQQGSKFESKANQIIVQSRGKSDMTVGVTIVNGKITAVEVLEHNETEGLADRALADIPAAIVKANSADVDAVTGATLTSNGIKAAVKDALSQVK